MRISVVELDEFNAGVQAARVDYRRRPNRACATEDCTGLAHNDREHCPVCLTTGWPQK